MTTGYENATTRLEGEEITPERELEMVKQSAANALYTNNQAITILPNQNLAKMSTSIEKNRESPHDTKNAKVAKKHRKLKLGYPRYSTMLANGKRRTHTALTPYQM